MWKEGKRERERGVRRGKGATDDGARWIWRWASEKIRFRQACPLLQVKKGHMAQGTMLALNQLLMGITTAPALGVLAGPVRPLPAAVSLALNFVHRGHELANVAAASSAALCATFIFS